MTHEVSNDNIYVVTSSMLYIDHEWLHVSNLIVVSLSIVSFTKNHQKRNFKEDNQELFVILLCDFYLPVCGYINTSCSLVDSTITILYHPNISIATILETC